MKQLIFIVLAGFLIGCVHPSRNTCESQDAYSMGLEAGLKGESSDRFDHYRSACEPYDIALDEAAFAKGFTHGVEQYCDVAVVYELAKNGEVVHLNRCTHASVDGLDQALRLGLEYQEFKLSLDALKASSRELEASQSRVRGELKANNKEAKSSQYAGMEELYEASERRLRREGGELRSRKARVDRRIRKTENHLANLETYHLSVLGLFPEKAQGTD